MRDEKHINSMPIDESWILTCLYSSHIYMTMHQGSFRLIAYKCNFIPSRGSDSILWLFSREWSMSMSVTYTTLLLHVTQGDKPTRFIPDDRRLQRSKSRVGGLVRECIQCHAPRALRVPGFRQRTFLVPGRPSTLS